MAQLIPGHVVGRGRTVEVARTFGGDFDLTAKINGASVAMVLDTGASSVVLTREDAKAAGLPLEVLAYTANIDTANGRTRAARCGSIASLSAVWSSAPWRRWWHSRVSSRPAARHELSQWLQSWEEVRGDRLLLRGYP